MYLPKAMVPVMGKPYLEHVLEKLPHKVKEVALVIGYRGDIIRQHFGEYYRNKELRYVWQLHSEDTNGAIQRAIKILRSETVSVLDIDSYESDRII